MSTPAPAMKHVFFVHSNITWLVSRAVIRHLGVRAEDVLLVRARGFVPAGCEYAQVDFPVRGERLLPTRHVVQWLRERRVLARFVDGVATGEFTWYLPHTALLFFPAFIGHPRCRGFSLIEEGMASYHRPGVLDRLAEVQTLSRPTNWRARLVRRLGLAPKLQFADPRYLAVYGCTDEAFPDFPRKVRVSIREPAPAAAQAIEAVVVFDAVLEHELATPAAFFQCLDDLVERLHAEGRRTVHFKLHPQQAVDTRYVGQLRQALEHNRPGIRFVELPPDFSLEQLAAAGRADFFVFVSSVAIYAAEAGCRVFSMARRVAELDPRYQQVLAAVPEAVLPKLRFL